MTRPSTVPLTRLTTGEKARVLALRGGSGFQHRIMSMGLSIGSEVEVMQNDHTNTAPGPIAVRVGETRLMIGHGMAAKVIVRPERAHPREP